jgi:hypothetical protein
MPIGGAVMIKIIKITSVSWYKNQALDGCQYKFFLTLWLERLIDQQNWFKLTEYLTVLQMDTYIQLITGLYYKIVFADINHWFESH